MERSGKTRKDYKVANRGLVLKSIATGLCSTRADLARVTGLSKMAISNIVGELVSRNLISETETPHTKEVGRRSNLLSISDRAPKFVGLLITRARCEAVVCDMNLNILHREYAAMQGITESSLIALIYQLLDTVMRDRSDILAIGIASVGPISVSSGKILKPYYFFDIHDFDVVRIVEERYQLPVFFDHDNQSAMLSESLYGSAQGYDDAIFVGVSEGIGCGILVDGGLYANHNGLSPELGHISIDFNGNPCSCGRRGCVETYVRTPVLLEQLRTATGKYYTYQQFCAMSEDPVVDRILSRAVRALASAIVSMVNILNSELILLGNDCAYWPDKYLNKMEETINQNRFVDWDTPIIVRRPHFDHDSALLGAVCDALVPVFSGKLLFED